MEEKNNGKFDEKTIPGIGSWLFFFILGIFTVNFLFLVYRLLESESYFPLFFLAIWLITIGIIILAILKRITFKKNVAEYQENLKKNYEKQCLAQQQACVHEDGLRKSNEELKRINQEYQETTKKLFDREMELTKANKRLQELDQIKSEFVSVAAHQLRTPLTGIKWSYMALLDEENGTLNKEQRAIAEQGLENINYSIDLINDLLNTARLDEGKVELNITKESIAPIIKEVVSQHEPVIKEKNIAFDIDYPPDSTPLFDIDKEKISIVFDNILANAVKYTPPKGKITLRHIRKGNKIQFKISDTGIGIPEKDLPKVFTKFFRSKNAVSFQTSGSGLGLYVAKSIIEKHGGKIELESIEKGGTSVIFSLPLK